VEDFFLQKIIYTAKNLDLVKHYSETLGANRVSTRVHMYRMKVDEMNVENTINKYMMEGDLNVV